MLPAEIRMRRSVDFERTIRSGKRAGAMTIVVHAAVAARPEQPAVGLVVSKAVGNAVTRNRVKRRLRAAMRSQLDDLGSFSVVIRANQAAADASFSRLDNDVQRCLRKLNLRTS